MANLINYLKKLKSLFTQYVYTNRLFFIYLVLSICGTIILREVTINIPFSLKPFLVDLGLIILIGSFGYFIKPKNQFKYFFIWIIIFTIINIVNSIYYTFYSNFASIAELSTLSQAETVTDSIFSGLRLVDFIYILEPVIFYYFHNNLKYSYYYYIIEKVEKSKKMIKITFVVGIICIACSFITASGSDFSRLSKHWNRTYVVERFGIIMYQFNDIIQSVRPRINSLFGYEDAKIKFENYFENKEDIYIENEYTNILKGYNLVYVHMESIQNFLMNLSFNDEQVTPNLNKLAKEGMFFSNFYPQVSTGTSSDAEYIMLSGLLPVLSGTIFVNYPENKFNTILHHLKDQNYYTFSMHGNYSSMWNRNKIHPNLGYEDLYYRDTFLFNPSTDTVGLGINDKLFFEQAVEKLENIEREYTNYFGTIITLSNHSPFKYHESFDFDLNNYYINNYGETVSSCYLCDRDIGNYIVSSHYADEALGDFLTYIKNSELFNDTIFVFYGDHDAKMSYKDMFYLYNYDYTTGEVRNEDDNKYIDYDIYDYQLDKKTPLIIWTKNENLKVKLNGEINTIMGMYDVVPTLYNMLGIKNEYVLGHDIFNIKDENIVVYPNGNFLTDKVYYNNSTGQYKILKENIVLDANYINENIFYAESTLDVGNFIIMYDLFNNKKRSGETYEK